MSTAPEQPNIPEKFLSPYDPNKVESRLYAAWEDSDFFNPDMCVKKGITRADAKPFSIVLPPPNVTGTLHLGGALMVTIEDILVRYQRMRGKKTLWLPGTDSAAIATQTRVEKNIQKAEGKTRHDLGREELLKRISAFVEENKATILKQFRGMGASLDWSRYLYTMDEQHYRAVMEAFIRMYDAGLIYRGNRIVNWDPKGQTTISDDEIVHEERDAKLYTFRYAKDFPIPIATTRLETKVGDTAVAVHPDDERYKKFIGKEYDVVFCDTLIHIKIIADESVEKDFGTGALGVTPAHSHIDWEIADRHNLQRPQVINEYAKMMVEGRLKGKKVAEAREEVVSWLKDEGLLEKVEDIKQNVATAERTGAIIEPLPKLQWWVNVNKEFVIPYSDIPGIASGATTTLKEVMRKSVESGAVSFVSERYERVYYHWIDNLRDWCISRQIWFGHRIPVWYKEGEMKVQIDSPGAGWEQDEDVLDTWFSSGLWTFSTLGWPDKTSDLTTFHPTDVIESGYDILFFWMARMILMSGFFLGQVPFRTIYIHGLVRDESGRKLSKSLGNNIDPTEVGAQYGTDALRMGLIVGNTPGADFNFNPQKVGAYKKFANKLWNITRFIFSETEGVTVNNMFSEFTPDDQALTKRRNELMTDITRDMENYRFYLAAEKLYHYTWHEVADVILEESKTIFAGEDADAKASRAQFLLHTLRSLLIALHPFMPYVTEEIWQDSPFKRDERPFLMVEQWIE